MSPDEHLKAALRHAPDAQVAAPPEVSAQILAAAHRSAGEVPQKMPASSPRWLTTLLAWWRQPQISAAFATVMLAGVVGLLWRGDPPGPGRDRSPDVVAPPPATAPSVPSLEVQQSLPPPAPALHKTQSPMAVEGERAQLAEARAQRVDRTRTATAPFPASDPAPAPAPAPKPAPEVNAEGQARLTSNIKRQTIDADAARSSERTAAPTLAPATAAAATPGPTSVSAPAAPVALAAAPAPAPPPAPAPAATTAAVAAVAPTTSPAPAARDRAAPAAAAARMPLAQSRVQPDIRALEGWSWSSGSAWRDPDHQWMAALLQSTQGSWRPADSVAPLPGSLQLNRVAQGRVQDKLWLEPESLLWCSAGGLCLRSPVAAQQRQTLLEQLAR